MISKCCVENSLKKVTLHCSFHIIDENTVLFTLNEILIGPLAQNDSRIINHIRKHNFVQPPSKDPYNLTNYHEDPSMGQSTIVKNALRSMVSLQFDL